MVSLIAQLPPGETDFLAHILSFDSKNYHVWTYRQWLCRRFSDSLLATDVELDAIDVLINDDVRNNSAWNHRYFVCFGAEELRAIEKEGGAEKMSSLKANWWSMKTSWTVRSTTPKTISRGRPRIPVRGTISKGY